MKVNLAAQALSSSVADVIEYCTNTLKLREFQGSEATTVRFIRIIDRLFDVLNSRSPFAKGYKSTLRVSNKEVWHSFFLPAEQYILNIKDINEQELQCT